MHRYLLALTLCACGVEGTIDEPMLGDSMNADDPGADELASTGQAITCAPRMSVFPVKAAHNIGYDAASCGTGTCQITCPDQHANSDWGGAHHGIDVFAFQRAPLVATAAGRVTAVGVPSSTSGLRVRVRDACGWEYYYGHMDQAVVSVGQSVAAGQLIGYMGRSGAASTHLHFNVSPDGQYYSDINPLNLLVATSGTACAAPPPPPPPPPSGCGILSPNATLSRGEGKTSCDGRFTLVMQGDSNLVLYQNPGHALWSTGTQNTGADRAVMQGDGNLVVYRGSTALWHTHTNGHTNAFAAVQTDGNFVVYQGGTPLWNSGTCCH